MTVHFIGAGPGAPDLITVRGRDLIARCPVVLYAGSLVPKEVIAHAPKGARVIDTAPLTLDEIIAEMAGAHSAGQDVARVHSGDPSLYGAIGEQMRRLAALGIGFKGCGKNGFFAVSSRPHATCIAVQGVVSNTLSDVTWLEPAIDMMILWSGGDEIE